MLDTGGSQQVVAIISVALRGFQTLDWKPGFLAQGRSCVRDRETLLTSLCSDLEFCSLGKLGIVCWAQAGYPM